MSIVFKRGDTIRMSVTDTDNDLSEFTLSSGVRLGNFYSALEVQNLDTDAGTYDLVSSSDAWPLGSLDCDIKYSATSGVRYTETFQIIIVSEVTK